MILLREIAFLFGQSIIRRRKWTAEWQLVAGVTSRHELRAYRPWIIDLLMLLHMLACCCSTARRARARACVASKCACYVTHWPATWPCLLQDYRCPLPLPWCTVSQTVGAFSGFQPLWDWNLTPPWWPACLCLNCVDAICCTTNPLCKSNQRSLNIRIS